jgi:hypothetical protein
VQYKLSVRHFHQQFNAIEALQQANAALELDKNAQAAQLAALQTELSAVQAERQAFATQQLAAIEALQQANAALNWTRMHRPHSWPCCRLN